MKVIERYDCSGCGDVDTSKKVAVSADGTIVGLSGRVLRVIPLESLSQANAHANIYFYWRICYGSN